MQITATPTAYGGSEAQRLLNMLLQQQASSAGQDLPGADSSSTATDTPPAPPLSGRPNAARFTADTLSSLLGAQEAPPSSADVAAKLIKTADTNGDGSLSLDEIKAALNGKSTTSADALSQAFAKLDTNGDGQLSASELTSALDAKKAAHGGHHAPPAPPSSTDVANQLISAADTNGDGALSVAEVEKVLGVSSTDATDTLTAAISKLDTNGDGKLSATELSTALDAFRAAHQRSSDTTAETTQAVTA